MGFLRKAIARASGATLGFIAGDVPGAFAGYNAGALAEKLTSKKQTEMNGKKRKSGAAGFRFGGLKRFKGKSASVPGRGKKLTLARKKSRAKQSIASRRSGIGADGANGPGASIGKVRGKIRGKKSKPKLSRQFVAKVKRAIDSKLEVTGHFMVHDVENLDVSLISNKQVLYGLPLNRNGGTVFGQLFTPTWVMYMIS